MGPETIIGYVPEQGAQTKAIFIKDFSEGGLKCTELHQSDKGCAQMGYFVDGHSIYKKENCIRETEYASPDFAY